MKTKLNAWKSNKAALHASLFSMLAMNFSLLFFLLFMLGSSSLQAQEIGKKELSLSQSKEVPIGMYDAIGTIPGCTATLISDKLVLTAAHCVCPSQLNANNCIQRSTFTLHDVFPVDNPSTPLDESKTRRDVSISGNVRVHPEYTMRGWIREDYAVIELDKPIYEIAHVNPITLAEAFNIPFEGETLKLVGFGRTGADCKGPGMGKRMLNATVESSSQGGISFKNTKLHVCPGDSGGPILNKFNHVVGVASWGDNENSIYRPTSYAYNWIYNLPILKWSSCDWVNIEVGGKNSHQATQLCPNGSYLTALDLDGDRSISDHDAPVIGKARCCKISGSEHLKWGDTKWVKVQNSHSMSGSWCPNGYFITGIDLDACNNCDPMDSPLIGKVQCSKIAGTKYSAWGSSYWMEIGPQKSHQMNQDWCFNGSFITQIDLDRANASANDSPVVGKVKCSTLK